MEDVSDQNFEEKKHKIDKIFENVKAGIDHAEERMMTRTNKQTVNQTDISMMRHHEGEAAIQFTEYPAAEAMSSANRRHFETPHTEDENEQFQHVSYNDTEESGNSSTLNVSTEHFEKAKITKPHLRQG